MGQPNVGVTSAIAAAAQLTGVSARYLTATAARESAFDAQARATTSSAAGLYQFIDATWLDTLSRHAGKLGLEHEAELGREDALALRFDPRLSALLAGALTADNAEVLKSQLGRTPSDGELYAAHVLGAGDAVRLARAVETTPDMDASVAFPAAARANEGLFQDASGRRFTVAELAGRFEGMIGEASAAPAAAPVESAPPAAEAANEPGFAARWAHAARSAPLRLAPQTIELLARLRAPERAEPAERAGRADRDER